MGHLSFSYLPVLLLACMSIGQCLDVSLTRMSTLYLPTYSDSGPSYGLATGTVEQLSLDRQDKIIYGAGQGVIHVIDANDVSNLKMLDHVYRPDLDMTDVEVCQDGVFVSYTNISNRLQGGVLVYRTFDRDAGHMQLLQDIPMGSLPDMVYPTADCTIVVAIENEGVVVNGQFYDPPGGVGIIRFPSGFASPPTVKILDFTKFDSQLDQLSASGVRWVYRENGNKLSNNLEPEYVTFNKNYTKAYIALQENNAIAVVDMTTDEITNIHGLGFKQWGDLDPSDRDGGIHMGSWPIHGMYQPDSIHWVEWNGEQYILTANEGDIQDYGSPANFAESARGKKFQASDIASSVSPDLVQALSDDAKLGRLTFSKVDGKNAEGKYEKFYTYGGRSFSIWRASDMKQVYDSGSEFERKLAELRPDLFNNDVDANVTVADSMDKRSDNKGPEPEIVTVGELAGHLLIFVAIERPGLIAVYSVPSTAGLEPQFELLYTEGIPKNHNDRTYQQLYDDRELFTLDPEYVEFVPRSDGIASFPFLLVAGTVSGTVSILRVDAVAPAAYCTVCVDRQCDHHHGSALVSQCPSHQNLCLTSYTHSVLGLSTLRGCADETRCNDLYLDQTLMDPDCARVDTHGLAEGRACHFCCVGDNCNSGPNHIPSRDTMYKQHLVG